MLAVSGWNLPRVAEPSSIADQPVVDGAALIHDPIEEQAQGEELLPARSALRSSMTEQALAARQERGGAALPVGLTATERAAIPNMGSNAVGSSRAGYNSTGKPRFEAFLTYAGWPRETSYYWFLFTG